MDRSSIVLTAEQQFLVENSLEFVHWTIANLIPKSNCRMEYDDLFQEGCVALCHAAASYHGGTSFKTYAITVIRNHLIDCCRKQTSWRKYISEQSLDDPDAGLPTPFCTDHAHFSGVDTGAVLNSCKKHYRGVAKLGIDALVLKTKGFDCKDIAVLSGFSGRFRHRLLKFFWHTRKRKIKAHWRYCYGIHEIRSRWAFQMSSHAGR